MPATTLDPNTPILVGCAATTDETTPAAQGRSPYDLIAQTARLALDDTGAAQGMANAIDTVALIRSYADTSHRFASRLGGSRNGPASIARRLGLHASRYVYTWNGGNMPQYLVNQFAEEISRGATRAALICGGEALRTQLGVERAGLSFDWSEDPGGEPELVGDPRRGWNDHEDRHGLRAAIAQYPLFENAIRGRRGATPAQHLQSTATLMSRFAAVAAKNPLATRREGWSAERLATIDADNRWIGYPYPRFMVSNAFIDQAAAFLITSVGKARELGIDPSRWVFLHGCSDAHDQWFTTERAQLDGSPAMRAASRQAFAMAGKDIADMQLLDIYSCFPSAVEIACQELGIREDDPRGLTVTGGLVYFGGPGNSYVVMSICEMLKRLRAQPGAFGLVTANGNWVTKHSYGIYSTAPYQGSWKRESPATLQAELDRMPLAPFTQSPSGAATVETYTVMHDRNGPAQGIVLGRLDATGERFLANTPADVATLSGLQDRDSLGRPGTVVSMDGQNVFTPQ